MSKQIVVVLILIVFFQSCKKDLLHINHVQRLNSNATTQLNNVRFLNDSVCIAAGGDIWSKTEVIRSTDGGYTWTAGVAPQVGKAMFGMGVSPYGSIYLCGVDGDVIHSADNGRSWRVNRIDDWMHYVGGTFVTPDTGIFISTVLQRQCTITRVDTAFKIIDQQTFLFGLNGIYPISPSAGFIIGYGTVMKSTDHFSTWRFLDVIGDNFTALDIHGSEMWMCGGNGGIYHTYDGGETWQQYRNGNDITLPRYLLRSIVFKDEKHGWATGDLGKMIYTDDGGKHWMEYEQFTTANLRSIALCPNGDLLVAGDNGMLFRITPA